MTGQGEIDNTLSAIAYLAGRQRTHPEGWLTGYSFGNAVALNAGIRGRKIKAVVAVSPPVIPD